jgi:hypothetical protein
MLRLGLAAGFDLDDMTVVGQVVVLDVNHRAFTTLRSIFSSIFAKLGNNNPRRLSRLRS